MAGQKNDTAAGEEKEEWVVTKVCNEQVAIHGRTREAIRICKDRSVLKEYLSGREKEVVDMLMELYDEQEVLRSYVESEKYEVENATKIAMARRILKMGKLSVEEIAEGSGLTVEEVERLSDIQLV